MWNHQQDTFFCCVPSDEELEQPSGHLAGGQGHHGAQDPQAAGGAGKGDAGKQQTAGEKCSKWSWMGKSCNRESSSGGDTVAGLPIRAAPVIRRND